MDALVKDLRSAVRSLRKAPGFTLMAVVTLALGVGANTVVRPILEEMLNEGTGLVLALLGATVLFVLLISCANLANLTLVRTAERRHEIAVRTALGAGRGRIVRYLMTESVVIALLGGGLGLVLSLWGMDLLRPLLPPGMAETSGPDLRVLGFTLSVSLLSAFAFGLAPALRVSRPRLDEDLKEGGRRTAGVRGGRLRRILVGAEVALALVALIGAGLSLRGFQRLLRVDPGFDSSRLLTLQVSLSEGADPADLQLAAFYERVLERVAAVGTVLEVAAVSPMPILGGEPSRSLEIEGRPEPLSADARPWVSPVVASTGYFRTLGIPLVRGRAFSESDVAGAPAVALVSETAARRYWPGADPVGSRLRLGDQGLEGEGRAGGEDLGVSGARGAGGWVSVVGVVRDIRPNDVDGPRVPLVYLPLAQRPPAK